jgi:hypothetical protein
VLCGRGFGGQLAAVVAHGLLGTLEDQDKAQVRCITFGQAPLQTANLITIGHHVCVYDSKDTFACVMSDLMRYEGEKLKQEVEAAAREWDFGKLNDLNGLEVHWWERQRFPEVCCCEPI